MPDWIPDFTLLSQAASYEQEDPDTVSSGCADGKFSQIPEVFKAKKSGGGESRLLKTMVTTA